MNLVGFFFFFGVRFKGTLPRVASVFTAECAALSEAINVILSSHGGSFLVFSNSRSALQSLVSTDVGIKTNAFVLQVRDIYLDFFWAQPQR